MLRTPRHNWRNFLLSLVVGVIRFFCTLTDGKQEKVFIFDNSTYNRNRSKAVELLAWIHDHNAHRSLKVFKMLTLGWSDGINFLPVDFVLPYSAKAAKRVQGITKKLDKRTCGYKRRQEAMKKITQHLETMVKRALRRGIKADYILMDSWFSFPVILKTLGRHLPVISMAKDMPKVFYKHAGQWVRLSALYSRLKKRSGRVRILANTVVETTLGQKVKIVFVRHNHKRSWLATISTDIELTDEKVVRIYGKRWDDKALFEP